VIIHPAGIAHANVTEEGDFKYMAFNPSVRSLQLLAKFNEDSS
jgi:hypothetical protein